MSKGILSISDGIITAANKFNSSTAILKKAPVRNAEVVRNISSVALYMHHLIVVVSGV
jgi:hypothetical protein